MSINYRKCGISDVDLLIENRLLFLREIQTPPDAETEKEIEQVLREYLNNTLPKNEFISWIAEADGQVVGFSGMVVQTVPGHFNFISGRQGYILNMFSLPEFRGNGICTKLLELLTKEAVELGLGKLTLHATKDGENIYRNAGFVESEWVALEKKL